MTAVVLKAKHPLPGNAYGKVTVWVIGDGGRPDGAFDLAEKAVIPRNIGTWSVPSTGEVTVELDPTSELTPAGSVYRADFRKVGSSVAEALVFAGFTGVGPVYATDYIVDPPGALLPPGSAVAIAAEEAARIAADALLIPLAQKGAANGVATLGADSKIPGAQLPALAIGDTFVVASQAAMLALAAERGDVAVRTDLDPDGFFLLTADAPSVLANWVQITAPATVTSVDGATGAVSLAGVYVRFLQAAMDPDLLIVGAITRDTNGVATTAPVVWPDGSPGTYTATTVSTAHPGAVDAYTITYGSPVTRTYTQPAVTRNADGAVTNRPAMTVA